jgi:putative (di)nucleoside polyphosphate hydrolase
MAQEPNNYRPNVGIIVFNDEGKVFLGQRMGMASEYSWQFPQGGVDEGEDLETAARRELFEETGIRSVSLIGRTKDWVHYDFPPEVLSQNKIGRNFKGQKQIWFAFNFVGHDQEIDLCAHGEQEFSNWQWCSLEDVVKYVVWFKRDSYESAINEIKSLIS